MKISKRQLRRIIKEEKRKLFEDAIDSELDHLKKNIGDDIEHIRDLKDDVKDDHEEEVRAEKERDRKDESTKRKYRRIIRKNLQEMVPPKQGQRYDPITQEILRDIIQYAEDTAGESMSFEGAITSQVLRAAADFADGFVR